MIPRPGLCDAGRFLLLVMPSPRGLQFVQVGLTPGELEGAANRLLGVAQKLRQAQEDDKGHKEGPK